MPDLKYIKLPIPRNFVIFGSSGNLIGANNFRIGNKTKNGFLYLFDTKQKRLTRFWVFPNYYNIIAKKGFFFLFLKPNLPRKAKIFYRAFSMNFYNNLYAFSFQRFVTLHFVGVGYKVLFFKKRHYRKFKLYLWVGFCTWQVIHLPVSFRMKKKKESFRLLSLKIFSQHPKYFRKLYMLIKTIRLSEPYKGKGIRFMDEKILRKPGKTGRI